MWTTTTTTAMLLVSSSAASGSGHFQGHRPSTQLFSPPVLKAPTAEELVDKKTLPQGWDWRNAGGRNMVTPNVNQHIPVYCGSCWIHGTAAALNDRIKIMRDGAFPDVMLARQVMINCVSNGTASPGCDGGDPSLIYNHMREHKIPDESCQPYVAHNDVCTPKTTCMNCFPLDDLDSFNRTVSEDCFPVENYVGYGVGDYGYVSTPTPMMKEIYARGPITCGMFASDYFMYHYSENVVLHEGVFVPDDSLINHDASQIDHDVSVSGWGTTSSGIDYWIIRNSWGSYWGDEGWFKLARNTNALAIESNCSWAVPTIDDLVLATEGKVLGDYYSGTRLVSDISGGAASSIEEVGDMAGVHVSSIAAFFGGVSATLAVSLVATVVLQRKAAPQQPALLG